MLLIDNNANINDLLKCKNRLLFIYSQILLIIKFTLNV